MVDRGPLIVKHFSIIIYIEQMIGCWGCCLTLAESARQLVHHLKYVVHHNEHHLSIGGKIGHSEVVANLSLGCCFLLIPMSELWADIEVNFINDFYINYNITIYNLLNYL